jgi:hypothetical protein
MTSPIEPEAPQSTQPKGIGSWLALFLVGQGLLCAYALYTLSDAFGGFVVAFDPSIQSGAMFKPLAVLESVAQFARALAPLYGFYLVYKKSHWAPRFWTAFLVFMALANILDVAGGYMLASETSGTAGAISMSNDPSGSMKSEVVTTLRAAAWSLVWALYWQRSVRVKNTFQLQS